MIDFIVKLEDMLKASGIQDWELIYDPETKGYFLKVDDDVIYMTKVKEESENDKTM